MILLVEHDGLYRNALRRLLHTSLQREVAEARDPAMASEWLTHQLELLISNICFPDEGGNRDYPAAASFLREARRVVRSDLPIIGLTVIPPDDETLQTLLRENNFPEKIELFDTVATRPGVLVREAADALKIPVRVDD